MQSPWFFSSVTAKKILQVISPDRSNKKAERAAELSFASAQDEALTKVLTEEAPSRRGRKKHSSATQKEDIPPPFDPVPFEVKKIYF